MQFCVRDEVEHFSPDGCVAFKGGRGTLGMIGMCDKAGVKVWKVGWEV